MKKLYISKKLNLGPGKTKIAGDFINFCMKNLPIISDTVSIYLVDSREDFNIRTTAHYNMRDKEIAVYCKNRALVDILRSVAHELTHMMQDESGLIRGPIQDAGGFHEDQANAKAGELIKLYAKSHPNRRKIYESIRIPSSKSLW